MSKTRDPELVLNRLVEGLVQNTLAKTKGKIDPLVIHDFVINTKEYNKIKTDGISMGVQKALEEKVHRHFTNIMGRKTRLGHNIVYPRKAKFWSDLFPDIPKTTSLLGAYNHAGMYFPKAIVDKLIYDTVQKKLEYSPKHSAVWNFASNLDAYKELEQLLPRYLAHQFPLSESEFKSQQRIIETEETKDAVDSIIEQTVEHLSQEGGLIISPKQQYLFTLSGQIWRELDKEINVNEIHGYIHNLDEFKDVDFAGPTDRQKQRIANAVRSHYGLMSGGGITADFLLQQLNRELL